MGSEEARKKGSPSRSGVNFTELKGEWEAGVKVIK